MKALVRFSGWLRPICVCVVRIGSKHVFLRRGSVTFTLPYCNIVNMHKIDERSMVEGIQN